MSMLITSLHLGGAEIVIKVEPFEEIARVDWNHESLLFSLCNLFSCYTSGYLRRGLECWSLFKRGKLFYLFDPLGLELCEKICQRRAVLYKFETIELMIEQLFDFVNDSITDESNESIEIGVIISCPLSPCPDANKGTLDDKPKILEKKIPRKKCGKPVKTLQPFKTRWMSCGSTKKRTNPTSKL